VCSKRCKEARKTFEGLDEQMANGKLLRCLWLVNLQKALNTNLVPTNLSDIKQ